MPPHLALVNRKLTDVLAGLCPRLIFSMPPRHGKSEFVSKYLPVSFLGAWPEKRVMLGSYEAQFASTWGGKARDLIDEVGPALFGIRLKDGSSAKDLWNLADHAGGMSTAGVGGPMTGKGADLLIIDDPIKNAEDANSETIREKQKEWWKSTAYTRIEPGGSAVIMSTRWHQDDLSGFLIEEMAQGGERWEVLNLPALAEDNDPLGRQPGEALWPERYPKERLEAIRKAIGTYWFSALYQGRPQPPGGGFFKYAWFEHNFVDAAPVEADRVRYWDTAGTEDGGDWTAGVKMARSEEGVFYVEDVVRGQWSPHHRNMMIAATAESDGRDVAVWVEREAGVGGKERSLDTVKALAGYDVHIEAVTGSKENRAEPFSAQAEAGNVKVVTGAWNRAWLAELCDFPQGKHDDQVDGSSGGFNKLALGPGPMEEGADPFGENTRW